MELIEILLMALIDNGRCLLKAVPQVFAQVAGYGANLRPFFVEFLEDAVSLNDICFLLQSKCLGNECLFLLEVLLEVIFAELIVDLHQIIELLLIHSILLLEGSYHRSGHRSDGFPFGLQVTHLLHVVAYVSSLALSQLLHHIDDALFAELILLHLLFTLGSCFCTLRFIHLQQLAEFGFHLICCCSKRLSGFFCLLASGFLFLTIEAVELTLNLFHLFFDFRYIIAEQTFELLHEFHFFHVVVVNVDDCVF